MFKGLFESDKMGKKAKPKQNKKSNLKRMRESARRMREKKKINLSSSETSVFAKIDLPMTSMSTEHEVESSMHYVNLDMPSRFTMKISETINLSSSEPSISANIDLPMTSMPTEHVVESPVPYVNLDMPSTFTMKISETINLSSSEPSVSAKINLPMTSMLTEHVVEPHYVNLDVPSHSETIKLSSSEPSVAAKIDVPMTEHVHYVNLDDTPSTSTMKNIETPSFFFETNPSCESSMNEMKSQRVEYSIAPTSPLPYDVAIDYAKTLKNNKIKGHRVVDIHNFLNDLISISGHDSLFNCGLHTMTLKEEIQRGLTSKFVLHCNMCNKDFKIGNSSDDLNKNAVAGVMAAGCGHAQLKQFSAALDLPIISSHKYQIAQNEVCDEWEVTAWEEMKKAGEREKEAALEAGNIDKDGIPMIDVVVDGSWCKRSYRTNYSALSGTAAIIGRKFGQVLFLAVKNKYCCVCARAEKRNEVVKQHECFKNYSGSSTSMESTIICEGFKQSVDMHGVIYARFIADGDSSTYAKILETRPYTSVTVEKIGCRNHILRNFCTKLQLLKTDTKYSNKERKTLTNSYILRGRKYICDAIKHQSSSKDSKSESIKRLHKDIGNAMCHAYGYHEECNKSICSEHTESADVKLFFNTHLFYRIRYLVSNVASQARSLIENVDSNVVERFNGVIAKFIGGKRINYALKRSYQARCAGAIVSFNSGKILTTVHKTIHNQSPISQIKKFEEDVKKQREYNQTIQRKRNRKLIQKKIDFDYGEDVHKPDLDSESYELAKTTFLKALEKTDEERRAIEQRTILQSESGEWLELRRNLLTASNFGKVIKRKSTNTCANIVKNMLYKPNIDHVSSINHGKKFEKLAIEQLANQMNLNIRQCGLFIDEKYPFLGATPDGVADDMLIEIKCPIAPYRIGIDAAIRDGKMHFWKKDKRSGVINVNKNSDWFIQAQGQMHICKYSKCLLAVWYGENKIKIELLQKDEKFWKDKMEPKLISFYFDCLLPELVDPRHTRNMPIRAIAYGIPKTTEDKENTKDNTDTNYQKTTATEDKNEEFIHKEITITLDNM